MPVHAGPKKSQKNLKIQEEKRKNKYRKTRKKVQIKLLKLHLISITEMFSVVERWQSPRRFAYDYMQLNFKYLREDLRGHLFAPIYISK